MSGHTPGPIHANEYGSVDDSRGNLVPVFGVMLLSGSSDKAREAVANRDLFIEAVNVATETGLTPRQLAEQRAELLEALESCLRRATPWHDDDDDDRKRDLLHIEAIARAAIAKAKGDA